MDKIEQILAEIGRLLKDETRLNSEYIPAYQCALRDIRFFITHKMKDDKPSDDLEKELRTYLFSKEYLESKESGCLLIARHFVEWERKQIEDEWLEDRNGCFNDGVEEGKRLMEIEMLKNAVEYDVDGCGYLIPKGKGGILVAYPFDEHFPHKVKIIVIKEEEK